MHLVCASSSTSFDTYAPVLAHSSLIELILIGLFQISFSFQKLFNLFEVLVFNNSNFNNKNQETSLLITRKGFNVKMNSYAKIVSRTSVCPKLQTVSDMAFKVIDNASREQINTAVQYNQDEINKLLVKLLAVNYIADNETDIIKDIDDTTKSIDYNYCERKLLKLSPILGFSRKDYFAEYQISSDIQMKIVSYLKSLEILKTIPLINKKFKSCIDQMHISPTYSTIFSSKFFRFLSIDELCNYFESRKKNTTIGQPKMDVQFVNGSWKQCKIEIFDKGFRPGVSVSGYSDDIYEEPIIVAFSRIAPFGCMTQRKGNKDRLADVLSRGYCNETCDVYLDFSSEYDPPIYSHGFKWWCNKHQPGWRCGWINWYRTYWKLPRMCQIIVDVCIDQEWSKFNDSNRKRIERGYKTGTRFGKKTVSINFHIDDIEYFTYFGHKTTKAQQEELIQDYQIEAVAPDVAMGRVYNHTNWRFDDNEDLTTKGQVLEEMKQIVVTPCGVFNGITNDKKKKLLLMNGSIFMKKKIHMPN